MISFNCIYRRGKVSNKTIAITDPNISQYDERLFFTFTSPVHAVKGRHQYNKPKHTTLIYIATDNIYAAKYMKSTIAHVPTVISPEGCHIEYDGSKECFLFTAVYWFILALSDIMITQTFGPYNAPTSAFSKYAGTAPE